MANADLVEAVFEGAIASAFFNRQHFLEFGHCDGWGGVAIAVLAHLAVDFGGGHFYGEGCFRVSWVAAFWAILVVIIEHLWI